MRSGVLVSVHSFATDPTRGLYILAFLVITIGGSLSLYAWRAPKSYVPGGFELFSREFFLLVNNVILVCVAGLVLWGTLSPSSMSSSRSAKFRLVRRCSPSCSWCRCCLLWFFWQSACIPLWRRGKLTVTAQPSGWLFGLGAMLSLAVQAWDFGSFHWVGLIGFSIRLLDHFLRAPRAVRALRQGQN